MTWRISAVQDEGLPRRLRSARKRARMTLAQVAACTGRDISTVHTWETGKRGIAFDDLARYGACVHASIADLIGDDLPLREVAR